MATLKDEALAYEPKQTKNVADLPSVDVNEVAFTREATDKEGKEFKYKYIDRDGEEYRVPNKVIADLKAIMEENPKLSTFKVIRKGEGLKTTYTVVPLD